MSTIYLDPKDETGRLIALAGFPGYKGKKFRVSVHSNNSKFEIDLGMSGGTFSRFAFVKLDTMTGVNVNDIHELAKFFGNGYNRMATSFQMPEGFAIIEHAIFCGKDTGLKIHLLEANVTKLLPALVELTDLERKVLKATWSLKSSYMGRSRQQESGVSLIDWNTASETLKAKGLLAKNGAITPAGKNAAK